MAGHGRRKKRRVTPQDEEAARRKFLDALEAQRANALEAQQVASCSKNQALPSPSVQLPGYYYDEAKRRYFRISQPLERHERKQLEVHQQTRHLEVQKSELTGRNRHLGYGTTGHNWVNCLSQRHSDVAWTARGRDYRELLPRLFSGFLSSQCLEAQNVFLGDRLTALALHSRNVGAVGGSSGKLDVFRLERRRPGAELLTTTSQRVLPICDYNACGVLTSLQWRPVQELDLLVCHLGSDQPSRSPMRSGNVCYFRVGDQDTRGFQVMTTLHMSRMQLVDPWTARWNPADTSKFSIGCSGLSSAAYVDAVADTSNFQRAPPGILTSDVHAQSFFADTGHVVLNGTKSGGLWGWDIRSPRRMFEWEAKDTGDQPTGAVLDIHVLNDCRRAVIQRSNGELRAVDLRTFKPVAEFIQGATTQYLPHLRCAIDKHESVVVSGGDATCPLTVSSYDLQNGRRLASLQVPNAQTSDKQQTCVQQVQLISAHHKSQYDDVPEIWAISRNELYVCHSKQQAALDVRW